MPHLYKNPKSPLSHNWIPFLALLLPVTLFGIFIYRYNLNANRNYIDQMRLYSFQQASTQLGYIFEHFKGMASDMSSAPVPSDSMDTAALLSQEQALSGKLGDFEKQAIVESEAFYYVRGDASLYNSSEQKTYAQFEEEYIHHSFTFASFFSRLNQVTTPYILRIPPKDPEVNGGLIAIICPLAVTSGIPKANVFFLIREEALNEKFENYFGDSQGKLCVYTSNLNLVLSQNHPSASVEDLLQYKGIGLISRPEDKEVVLRQITADNELTIVSVMPRQEFYQDLRVSQGMLILLIILMVSCCLLIAAFGVKYTYRPLRRLAQDILGPDGLHDHKNEIELIRNAFDTSQERSRNLMEQLNSQNHMLSSQFVIRLISGKFQNLEEIHYHARCFGMAANRQYWIVMQLVASPFPSSRQMIDRLLEESQSFEAPGAICLFSEYLQHPGVCYLFHFDCNGDVQEFCTGIAEQLCRFVCSRGLTAFRIGVGMPCTDPMEVKRSSYEADAAMEGSSAYNEQHLSFYHPEQSPPAEDFCLPPMEKSILAAGISRGDTEVSLHALQALIDYIETSAQSFLLVRLLCSELSNLLLRLAQENRISYRQNNWTELVAYHDLNSFRCSAQELTENLCIQILKRRELDNTLQKSEVLSFIAQNFTRDDFSLDLTADSLNLTKAKISAILKEDIGMGFPQYISLLRINEVKRQLVETQHPIQEIIRNTGYLDVSNFIRRFKTLEGMTPGQYRNLHQKN